MYPILKKQQHGAVTVLTGFVLAVAVGALGVLGVGQTVWMKQNSQALADMAALTAARQVSDGPDFTEALNVATANGLQQEDTLVFECLIDNQVTNDCTEAITVRATLTRPNNPYFLLNAAPITAIAEATTAPVVAGLVSTRLLELNTGKSPVLDGILTAAGGGAVVVSGVDYRALVQSDVVVNLLDLDAAANIASPNELADVQVEAYELLRDAIAKGRLGNQNAALQLLNQDALKVPLQNVDLQLGDIMDLDVDGASSKFLNVNLGELAHAVILRSGQGKTVTPSSTSLLGISSELIGVSADITILQPPKLFIGRKLPMKSPIAKGKTAQVGVNVTIGALPAGGLGQMGGLLTNVLGININLQMRAGGGEVEVENVTCRLPRTENDTTLKIKPVLAEVCIAQSSTGYNTVSDPLVCGAPAKLVDTMTKQGNNPITVTLGAKVTMSSGNTTEVLEGAFPPVAHTTVPLSLGQSLENFLENVDINSQVAVETGGGGGNGNGNGGGGGLGGLLDGIINGIAYNVLESVKLLLGPVLGIVGYTLDNILGQLGINLNQVEVTMLGVDCSSSVLTR
ncbi:MAG: hypothetical protein QE278_03690 [Limnobacter sp.]|nr:hypothetical protein [Limnobacter sp.]